MMGNDDFGQNAVSNMTYQKGTLPRTQPDAEKGFNFYDAVLKANANTKKWIAYSVVVGSVIVLALSGVLVGLYLSGNLKKQEPALKVVDDPAASAGDRNALTGSAMGGMNDKKSLDGSLKNLGGMAPVTPSPIDPLLLMAAAGSDGVDNVQDAVSDIVETPREVVSDVVDTVSDIVETPREVLSDVVDNVGDALEAPREMMADTVDTMSDVLEAPSEVLSDVSDSVGDIVENAQEAVSDASEALTDRVEEVADNIGDIMEDGPSEVLENVIENVSDNIEDSVEGVSDAAEEVVDNIQDTLEDIVEQDSMDDVLEKILGDVATTKKGSNSTIDDDDSDETDDEDDDNDDDTDDEDDNDNTEGNDKSVSKLGDDDRTDDTDNDDNDFDDIFDELLKANSLPSQDKNVADKLIQSTPLTGNDEQRTDEDTGPFSLHNFANRASLLTIQTDNVPSDTSFNSANLDSSTSFGLRGLFGDRSTGKIRYQAAITNRAVFDSQPLTHQTININIPMPDIGLSETGLLSSSDWMLNDRSFVNSFNSLFSFDDNAQTTTEPSHASAERWQASLPTHYFDPFSSLMTHTAPIFEMRPFT